MKTFLIDEKDDLENIKDEYNEVIMNISEDIMLDNILDQIKDSNNLEFFSVPTHKDFFEYFEIRFKFILERYENEDEIVLNTKEVYNEILNKILNAIQETYEFEIEFHNTILVEEKAEYIKALYYFFVIEKRNNIINLFINNINKNFHILTKQYQDSISNEIGNSLSYNNFKKVIDNKYTSVIYSIPEIIPNTFVNDNESVIELIILNEESELNNYLIAKMLIEQAVCDVNFKSNFLKVLNPSIENNKILNREIQYYFVNKYKGVEKEDE